MRILRSVSPLVLATLTLAGMACRSAGRGVETSTSPRAPSSQSSGVIAPDGQTTSGGGSATAAVSTATARAPDAAAVRRDAAAGDEVVRTVVAVFGDTAGIRDSAALPADEAPAWDMDVRSYETHARVAHYVELFSRTGKDRFLARLSRGTRYEPMIRAKLRAGGLPEDMTFLALIESGYDPNAYSRAAAVGMWQFMSSTARDVGMRVDWWVDERRDPARSTDGAIRFLRDLQRQFGGSLYLAAAAYNGGPGRVSRGLTRFAEEMDGAAGEDRFFALAEQDYLRAETKNYVPQLIAAALVAKMPARYGIVVDSAAPYAYDSVRVDAGTSLAAVSAAGGTTIAELRELNPAILRGIAPPDGPYWVKVPTGAADRTRDGFEALPESSRRGFTLKRVTGTKTTPAAFASAAGVPLKALAAFNPGMKSTKKGRLVSGQSLRVPAADALALARDVPDPSIERYGTSATRTLASSGFHLVRRGESLGGVAKRYGLSTARLKALNGIKGTRLVAGQTLRVRSTAKRVSASKPATSRASARKTTVKTASARKTTATKPSAKAGTAKKASAKSASSKKSVPRKAPVKQASVKKPAAKKSSR